MHFAVVTIAIATVVQPFFAFMLVVNDALLAYIGIAVGDSSSFEGLVEIARRLGGLFGVSCFLGTDPLSIQTHRKCTFQT